jgi:hypothetical protein
MALVPESIRGTRTQALDQTWAGRLSVMRYGQLRINFAEETNVAKLELWLEMFGLSPAELQGYLTTVEYCKLLQNVIKIFKLSGTARSIEMIAQALGATSTSLLYKYVLYYNNEIAYDGGYYYDSGGAFKASSITIEVTGVTAENQARFIVKMKKLFGLFQPMWIYLEGIDFV